MVDKSIQLKAYVNGEILTAEDLNTSVQDAAAVQYLVPYNASLSKDSAGVVFLGTTAYAFAGIVLKTGYKLLQSDGVNTTEITLSGGGGGNLSNIEALSAAEKLGTPYSISEQYYLNESYTKSDPYMIQLAKNYGTGDLTLIQLHNDYRAISKCNSVLDGTGAWTSLGAQAGAALVGGTTAIESTTAIYCTVGATATENGLRYKIGTTGISLTDQKLRYDLWLSTLSNITSVKTLIAGNSGTVDNNYWTLTQQASGSSLVSGWNFMEVNLASTASGSAGSFSSSAAKEMHVLITPTSSQSFVMAVDDLCRVSKEEIDLPHIAQIGDTVGTQLLYVDSGANGVYQLGTTVLQNYNITSTTIGQRFVPKNGQQFEFPTGSTVLSGASAKEIWDISSKDLDAILSNKTVHLSGQFNSDAFEIIDIPSANSMKLKTVSGTGDSLNFVAGSEMVGFSLKWNGYEYVSPVITGIGSNHKKFTISGSTTVSGEEITVNHTESNSGFDANGKFFVVNKVADEYYGVGNTGSKIELVKATPTIWIPKDEGIVYPAQLHSHFKLDGNGKNSKQPSGIFDLTTIGIVPYSTGKIGLSAGVFSSTNYLRGSQSVLMESQDFWAECWVNFSSATGAYQSIYGKGIGATNGWGIVIEPTSGKVGFEVATILLSTGNICDGLWHHVLVCQIGSGANTRRLYLDGTLNAQTTSVAITASAATYVHVGYNVDSAGYAMTTGRADELAYGISPPSFTFLETLSAQRYNGGRGRGYGYSPGYIQKSTISNLSGNKLITATRLTRQNAANQNPIVYQRNAVIV